MHEISFTSLKNIIPVKTAHGVGEKFVFLTSENTSTDLTQVAFGTLLPGEVCPMHVHPTMEEFFLFLNGSGKYTISNNEVLINPGTFVRIPAGVEHALEAFGDEVLQFFYFGIAVTE